jgi:hypothetical protein
LKHQDAVNDRESPQVNPTPSIGVAIPTYRRDDQLHTLLQSLPARIPVYVSDNGCTVSGQLKATFPAVVFRCVNGDVVPMFANWNVAARMVSQDWVLVPSDDDIYFPDSFDCIEGALAAHEDCDVLVFGHHVVGERYEILSSWKPDVLAVSEPGEGFIRFADGVAARMPSIAFRRALLQHLDYFDENMKITAADSDLIQRALLVGRTAFVPAYVSGYRVWGGGATSRTIGTAQWMADVDYWGSKVERLLANEPRYADRARLFRDETYAQNLAAGLRVLGLGTDSAAVWRHFSNCRFPLRASPTTQLRLVLQFGRALLRSALGRKH